MKALVMVDVQRDFLPGGKLPVKGGDRIIPVINEISGRYPLVAVTQDWHPPGHRSFASSHPGREPMEKITSRRARADSLAGPLRSGQRRCRFPENSTSDPVAAIFRKGMDPDTDSYSGFFDNGHRHKTGLAEWLRGMDVDEVHIVGLAAEICVAYTARDAAELGFQTTVIEDATRALSAGDFGAVKRELSEKGVRFRASSEIG